MNMEKTDMQKKVMVLACGLLCLVTTIGSAVAQNDNKAYPGSACKPNPLAGTGSDPVEILQSIVASNGVIFNLSPDTSHPVVCPLVRDNTVNTDGLSGDAWLFATTADVNGDRLECRFIVTSPETGAIAFQSAPVQANFGNDRIELPMNQSTPLGGYLIACTLPPGSRINAYAAPEPN
jgi:hypothetical protein